MNRAGGYRVPGAGRAGLLALLLSACASGAALPPRPSLDALPAASPLRSRTLAEGDAWLRHHLMFAEYDRALALLDGKGVPSDRLWRELQRAMVLHAAGDHQGSNAAFEWAEMEADRRYTRSVSRAAGSVIINDRVLAYTPSGGELAMIPYYRMLNYLALGDRSSAMVEARKAVNLLSRLERDPADRCVEDGMLQYLAGLVFSAGGERNDALVSLRQAEASFRGCPGGGAGVPQWLGPDLYRAAASLGAAEIADSARQRYALPPGSASGETGDLVLLLEHGYVAHRAEEALHLPIFPEEIEELEGGDAEGIATTAATVSARLMSDLVERARWGSSFDDHPVAQVGQALEGAYILRLAWPVFRRDAGRPASVRVWVNDSIASVQPLGDLSSVVEREMEARQAAVLARAVARGLTKYLMTRQVEERAEKEGGEFLGFLTARLGNLAVNELERADTRSWSLLPDRVSMARLRLPPGEYRVRVETLSASGEVAAVRDLGVVRVEPGSLAVRNERVWGFEPRPSPDRGAGSGTAK